MKIRKYMLVDEGNVLDGPCYRIYLEGHILESESSNAWVRPDFFSDAVKKIIGKDKLYTVRNGTPGGNWVIPDREFERICKILREDDSRIK